MGWNDHVWAPEDCCANCALPVNWEDVYEDANGDTICGKCRDKLREQGEALYERLREESALDREVAGRKQDRREADRINGRYTR